MGSNGTTISKFWIKIKNLLILDQVLRGSMYFFLCTLCKKYFFIFFYTACRVVPSRVSYYKLTLKLQHTLSYRLYTELLSESSLNKAETHTTGLFSNWKRNV
jgi:hypothetical protein